MHRNVARSTSQRVAEKYERLKEGKPSINKSVMPKMAEVSYDKPMARTFREIIALNTEKLIENKNL